MGLFSFFEVVGFEEVMLLMKVGSLVVFKFVEK